MADTIVRVYDDTTEVLIDGGAVSLLAANAAASAASAAASAGDAGADAANAAADAAEAAATKDAIQALIDGYPGSAGQTIPVASRAAAKAIANPVGSFFLYESGREGELVTVDYATFATLVDADTREALFFRSTATPAKAFLRIARRGLDFKMAGGDPTGATDNTQLIRDTIYIALKAGVPIRDSIKNVYRISNVIRSGSLTTDPPADGLGDNAHVEGVCFLIAAAAGSNCDLKFRNCSDITVHNIKFDMSEATTGHASVSLDGVVNFDIQRVRKFGTATTAVAPTGSSGVSLNNGSMYGSVRRVRVRDCGPSSTGVFLNGASFCDISDIQAAGGQEVIDLSNSHYNTISNATAWNAETMIDCGNSTHNSFSRFRGIDCQTGITVKTEDNGPGIGTGSNDNRFDDITLIDFTEAGVQYNSGGTTTQTLHRNWFINVRMETSADAALGYHGVSPTKGFLFVSGDATGSGIYTQGTVLDNVSIDMSIGIPVSIPAMEQYSFSDLRWTTGGSVGIEYTGASLFERNVKASLRDVTGNGDVTISRNWGLRLDNINLTGGRLRMTNAKGLRARNINIDNAPGDAFALEFSTNATTNWNIEIKGYTCTNNSVTTANLRGLRISYTGAGTPAYSGINLFDVLLRDDQAVPTSGGFNFGGATFDTCSMINCRHINLKAGQNDTWAWTGLNSFNSANRLIDPSFASFGNLTLGMRQANQRVRHAAAGTLTVPADATTVFPIGTVIEIENNGALPTLAAAAGVTIKSKSGWLKVSPSGGVARLKKMAANEWTLEGDLAA